MKGPTVSRRSLLVVRCRSQVAPGRTGKSPTGPSPGRFRMLGEIPDSSHGGQVLASGMDAASIKG